MASDVAGSNESISNEDNEEEAFQDALEKVNLADGENRVELGVAIRESSTALMLFLSNRFIESRERFEPYANTSMYHSLGYGTMLYIQAVMTFDMGDIETAIQAMKKAVIICHKHRRKVSVFGSLAKAGNKHDYSELTSEEIHAELCYAEGLLIRALLTFIQDENLISFVKGGLKIRECYKIYKECNKILQHREWTDEDEKLHFESGVRMGVGSFNLMISLLPGKILKLLEFIGFSGNKKLGLTELKKGSDLVKSLRGPLCSIILVAYHTVVCYVLGLGDGDIDLASEVLAPHLKAYPKGALFLFFAGRIEEVRANIDEAIYRFEESIESQSEWHQFHHLCYWELMWCHCFKCDWLLAMKYAEKLCKESRWSKATYTYQKAAFLMACDDLTEDTKKHLDYLFKQIPKLKVRIAGKSLPIEKFAVSKTKRYDEQGGRLTLPALELVYVWNGFAILGKRPELVEPILEKVEKTIIEIVANENNYVAYHDDYSLALLLKGVCLKCRGQMFQAEQCFKEILTYEKKIKHDTFLLPYAAVELALLFLLQENIPEVLKYLEKAKKGFKGYLLESRLHFRIHAIKLQLKSGQNSDSSLSPPPTPGTKTPEKYATNNDMDLGSLEDLQTPQSTKL